MWAKRFTAKYAETAEEEKREVGGKLCSKKSSLCVLCALRGENSLSSVVNSPIMSLAC
jgi:hypothetical protein